MSFGISEDETRVLERKRYCVVFDSCEKYIEIREVSKKVRENALWMSFGGEDD